MFSNCVLFGRVAAYLSDPNGQFNVHLQYIRLTLSFEPGAYVKGFSAAVVPVPDLGVCEPDWHLLFSH